ncbi:MAG: helix-turn-helix transcriptional regulator [Clostridiales bacterium]|nr:helix-turn-helix transcriptional regulator [Clostridiales bacterium]
MTVQKAVAIRLSNLMINNNTTQYEIAKRMNTDKNTIKHILNEDYKSIKFDTVIKIAQAFNMILHEFLDDKVFNYENIDL